MPTALAVALYCAGCFATLAGATRAIGGQPMGRGPAMRYGRAYGLAAYLLGMAAMAVAVAHILGLPMPLNTAAQAAACATARPYVAALACVALASGLGVLTWVRWHANRPCRVAAHYARNAQSPFG